MSDYEQRMREGQMGRESLEELEAVLGTANQEIMEAERGMKGPQYRNLKRYLMLAGLALEGAMSESLVMRKRLEELEGKVRQMVS